ncbi:MAG: hypothetical protein LBH22_01625 [Bacteroidales bacterium]|jgi:hypothetical protein|nr:hypothetical protein [Bacteroidales bacterium]
MKKIVFIVSLATAIIFLGMGLSSCGNVNAQPRSNVNAIERWEYRVIKDVDYYDAGSKNLERIFNELGKEGWEYAGNMAIMNSKQEHYFKRRLP